GFFGNTLVLRNQINAQQTFSDFVKDIEKNTLAAFSHQDIPFEMLVDELVSERDMSSSPLFQSMFTLVQDSAKNKNGNKNYFTKTIRADLLNTEQLSAKYDFSLSITVSATS